MDSQCFEIAWLGNAERINSNKEMNPALNEKLTFLWPRKMAHFIFEHNILDKMISNFDQSPVGFTSPSKKPPSSPKDILWQCIRKFLPTQHIYGGLTYQCHSRVNFPSLFHITHSKNYWSNWNVILDY